MNVDLPPTEQSQHWLRPFVEYLIERKVLGTGAMGQILKFRSQIDLRIGQLAAVKGYITATDVLGVLASQAEENKLFGELAVRNGFMTGDQVEEVIRLQKDPFRLFLETLLLTRVVEEDKLRVILKDFLESSRIVMKNQDQEKGKEELIGADETSKAVLVPDTRVFRARPRKADIHAILHKVKGLATLSTVVQKVLTLLNDPDVKFEKVADALQGDQALTTQILRMVNSAFFGLRGKVGSVRQAVMTIGLRGIRQTVLATQLIDKLKGIGAQRVKGIWKHTIWTSIWTRALAKAKRRPDLEDAALAGLMHDLGKPVILQYFPEETVEIEKLMALGRSSEEAENEALGLTHADIGAYLSHYWTLPPPLSQAVLYHHAGPGFMGTLKDLFPLTPLVAAGCKLASLTSDFASPTTPSPDPLAALDEEFLQYHGVKKEILATLLPQVQKDAEELTGFLL